LNLFHKLLRQLNITNTSWLQAFAENIAWGTGASYTGEVAIRNPKPKINPFAEVLAQLVKRLNGINAWMILSNYPDPL
jgi:hypothetical protein